MKKLVSAVTSLCMAATMIGSVVPAVTSAADAKKGFSIKAYADSDSKYASEGSKVTVSKEDIAAGDVTIPCAVYLSENTPDTEAFSVQLTVNSEDGDASGVKFKGYETKTNYFSANKDFTTTAGKISTKKYMSFAGSVNSRGVYMPAGSTAVLSVDDKQISAGTKNAYLGYTWTTTASYTWLGDTSDKFPIVVFDVTIPKGSEGTYTLDFCNYNTDASGKNTNPSCMIENKDPGRFANYEGYLSNLDLNTMTIVVGDSAPTTTTTANAATTTTTTTTAAPVVTTTTAAPSGNAEISLDLGNYKVKPGETFDVEVKIDCHNHAVSGGQFIYTLDSPLKIKELVNYSPALDDAAITVNPATKSANFTSLVDSEPSVIPSDQPLFIVSVTVPENTPAGDYKIGYSEAQLKKGNRADTWNTEILNGIITVEGDTPATTTTTSSATTTKTSTTTTKTSTTSSSTTSSSTTSSKTTTSTTTTSTTTVPGTPNYGDTNCDGKVNVADVVLLNKWLADNKSYNLTAQGALNADCFNPKAGKDITSADSDAIIKSIVHLVTLPVQG